MKRKMQAGCFVELLNMATSLVDHTTAVATDVLLRGNFTRAGR